MVTFSTARGTPSTATSVPGSLLQHAVGPQIPAIRGRQRISPARLLISGRSMGGNPVPAPPREGQAAQAHQQHPHQNGQQPRVPEAGAIGPGDGGCLGWFGGLGDRLVPVRFCGRDSGGQRGSRCSAGRLRGRPLRGGFARLRGKGGNRRRRGFRGKRRRWRYRGRRGGGFFRGRFRAGGGWILRVRLRQTRKAEQAAGRRCFGRFSLRRRYCAEAGRKHQNRSGRRRWHSAERGR